MRFLVSAHGPQWCGERQREQLERYGFLFGPVNPYGLFSLVGPVTGRSNYGHGFMATVVEIGTLHDMLTLLQALGTVCIITDDASPDGEYAFLMTPIADDG